MTSHRNHYVPQWYQRCFLRDSKTPLYYLDLSPEKTILPTGVEAPVHALQRNSPKRCFWAENLYTTTFGNVPNDEIERFLFGSIDNEGAIALRAVVSADMRVLHDKLNSFFAYMDAQKLRTPKGLDWIKSNYPKLGQIELMGEMQYLRQMHCTMWVEAVREIVSAEESDIKFIISDHPITIYHPTYPPNSTTCAYPHDPDVALVGSQTLFPLGPDHCLILTNLEYAEQTEHSDLTRKRLNARHFDNTITRIDSWIRSRKLDRNDVSVINRVIKARARRFIAAAEESWLYPESQTADDWTSYRKVLLPPRNELWHFGGEMFIGFKDGTSHYQDAYGRTSGSHEYLHKEQLEKEPAPTEPCICGSGRPYMNCCKDVAQNDRMPANVYSIRERNLMLGARIEDILGIRQGASWDDVRRNLSDSQVKEIHSAYGSLWPTDTDIADLLPRPDSRVFRALYAGLIDPRLAPATIIGWLRVFDEILVLNPLVNPVLVRPEYSPTHSPSQHKEQTIMNIALFFWLLPFVREGIVHLIPDPMEFNISLREAIWHIAKEKSQRIRPGDIKIPIAQKLAEDDFKRMLGRLPDNSLKHQIRQSSPDLDESTLSEVIRQIRTIHAEDPLALDQLIGPGKNEGQLKQFKGISSELAMFLAQLTGSTIYTDVEFTRRELLVVANANESGRRLPPNENTNTVLNMIVPIHINPDVTSRLRETTASQAVRANLRNLWNCTLLQLETEDSKQITGAIQDLSRASEELIAGLPEERVTAGMSGSDDALISFDTEVIVPSKGIGLNSVRRFLLTFGGRRYITEIPLVICFGDAVGKTSN